MSAAHADRRGGVGDDRRRWHRPSAADASHLTRRLLDAHVDRLPRRCRRCARRPHARPLGRRAGRPARRRRPAAGRRQRRQRRRGPAPDRRAGRPVRGRAACRCSAIALHAETSALTAIGNDYGFAEVFARQVRAHGRPGDVLLLLSTSGAQPATCWPPRRPPPSAARARWALTGPGPNPLAAALRRRRLRARRHRDRPGDAPGRDPHAVPRGGGRACRPGGRRAAGRVLTCAPGRRDDRPADPPDLAEEPR